jgi:hypothetical protein
MTSSNESIVYVNEFFDLVGPETEILDPFKIGSNLLHNFYGILNSNASNHLTVV